MLTNDNNEVWDRCENCGEVLRPGHLIFEYSECRVCLNCAPNWKQAKKGFEVEAFEQPDNWRNFCERLRAHLASGGVLTDKCTEIWEP